MAGMMGNAPGTIGGSGGSIMTPQLPKPTPSPTSIYGNPATFTGAANTQGSDYDTIMAGYQNQLAQNTSNPIASAPVTAAITPYTQSPDVTNSLATLSNLATTGGYTPAAEASILARDESPIRSVYANAQQNLDQQKALSGGYSPNYAAATTELARQLSSQIGGTVTNANANLAQSQIANELAAASPYASAASNANAAQTNVNQANTAAQNTAAEANANRALQTKQTNAQVPLSILQGMSSIYGTTPALTNTFGNQVANATQLGQNQQNINNQQYNGLFNNLARLGA